MVGSPLEPRCRPLGVAIGFRTPTDKIERGQPSLRLRAPSPKLNARHFETQLFRSAAAVIKVELEVVYTSIRAILAAMLLKVPKP